MAAALSTNGSKVAEALDRHEGRREGGLPVVTALVGPVGLAIRAAGRWVEGRGRSVVLADGPGLDDLAAAWVEGLARGRDLRGDAAAWLARALGEAAGELIGRLGRMTAHELELFLDAAPPLGRGDDVTAACRWLLERAAAGDRPGSGELARQLCAALPDGVESATVLRVAAALGGIVPGDRAPALLVARRSADRKGTSSSWVDAAARSLAALAAARPRLTLLLAITPGDWEAYGREGPESRAKALIRAGIVEVGGLGTGDVESRLRCTGLDPSLRFAGSIRRLSADGASNELVDAFAEAVRSAESPEDDDRARSAAERFLFERLASLPATAGLFTLNADPGFAFGPSTMEVDLLSTALSIAIEIDGYHHFRNAEAYRRDRRKDVELQRRGYLVLRFLADDVVAQLEDVLGTILAAVALRRGRALPRTD